MKILSRRMLLASGISLATLPFVDPAHCAPNQLVKGWREAILIVPALEPWIEVLTKVGGWDVLCKSAPDAALNELWTLPAAALTEQVLMHNIGTKSGFLRLVKITGAEQRFIRDDDQAWETGGISALDLRVLDIESTRSALHARGWRAPSDPVQYKTYGFEVIQWVPVSPDGIRLSFIQRIAPPLQGWTELKRWSRASNAAIVVKDMDLAQKFFGDALAMPTGSRSSTVGSGGPNVLGLPWPFAQQLSIDIQGFYPGAEADSSIELLAIPQARGRDYSSNAHPPNLGIAALRFVVGDALMLANRLNKIDGTSLVSPLNEEFIAPYGRCKLFAYSAPDGVRIEFLQSIA